MGRSRSHASTEGSEATQDVGIEHVKTEKMEETEMKDDEDLEEQLQRVRCIGALARNQQSAIALS